VPFINPAWLNYPGNELRRRQVELENIPLGTEPTTGDIFFLPERERDKGGYVIGRQGSGKSRFLEGMINADIAKGNAVIVIDPHGDLINHCLAALPRHRVEQTFVLNMLDEGYPYALNALEVGKLDSDNKRTQAVESIYHIFDVLWPEVLSQAYLPRYMRAATIALLANPGGTLVDMQRFLLEDDVRMRMLNNVIDESVLDFWEKQYNVLTDVERNRRIQPLLGKLETLFMGRSLVRNILGQSKTSISFRGAIDRKEVIFIRLPVNEAGQDARLIGTLLMAKISAAIFSYQDTPAEQRPGVSLYVDEFQNFTTPDFEKLYREGRKYGARITLAHQGRDQLPGYLQDATASAYTKVVFNVIPEDASEMGQHFMPPAPTIDPNSIETNMAKVLLERASDFNEDVVEFVDVYLRPLQSHKRGGKIDIEDLQLAWSPWSGMHREQYFVEDPTPYLNGLLYAVMRTGNASLPIPWEAAIGFANCGRKFFTAIRNRNAVELDPRFRFPPDLVVQTHQGLAFTHVPRNAREALLHFIFSLRQTMAYFAQNPIGKMMSSNASAIGQMLTQLPDRVAFVRSGNDQGTIYTFDSPTGAQGLELNSRLQHIEAQTRATYCRPKEEVEKDLRHKPKSDYRPPSRYEEVDDRDEPDNKARP
jgi:TraM recognition site of TraD and TraG